MLKTCVSNTMAAILDSKKPHVTHYVHVESQASQTSAIWQLLHPTNFTVNIFLTFLICKSCQTVMTKIEVKGDLSETMKRKADR